MKRINKIEDIYPLSIVMMKYGKIAIIEALSCCDCISSLQEDENWSYDPHHFMKEKYEHIKYGIGDTIDLAFCDFKSRYKYEQSNL